MQSIGDYAFYYCTDLANVTLPHSVQSIGDYAFYYCTNLANVKIGNGAKSIGDYAFYRCNNLTSTLIGDSVESIGTGAFYDCSGLMNVYYRGSANTWAHIYIKKDNTCLTTAIRYDYSGIQPTDNGRYWHYVDGEPTPWNRF